MTDPADIPEPPRCTLCPGWDTNRTEDHADDCPMVAEPPADPDTADYLGADQ